MAVESRGSVPGMTGEQYLGTFQQVRAQLQAAPGFIAHIGVVTETGVEVTEVWESREQAQAWIDSTIAPMLRAAGAPVPTLDIRPVHNLLLAGQG